MKYINNEFSHVGLQFKTARLRSNLTQADLALQAGINRLNVVQLEAGKNIGLHIALKVMQVLNLAIEDQVIHPIDTAPIKIRVRHQKINAEKYPQLKFMLWDHSTKKVTEEEAFYTYEKNAKFLDTETMGKGERKLLEKLTAKFGNGVML